MMEENDPDDRVSGYDLMAFNEKNARLLIERIKDRREAGALTYKALWKGAQLSKSDAALSRWVNGEAGWESIGKQAHQALVRYLIDNKHWYANQWEESARAIPDVLFHAVTSYLDIGHATKENIRKRVRGVFRVYHPSLILKDRYVVGVARLGVKPDAEGVSITVYFRYKPEQDGAFTFREIDEAYEGYLFRKAKKYFTLLRDRERTHMRMEVFPDTFSIERDIKMMRGAVISISENRGFYAPIYYEKIEAQSGESEDKLFARVKADSNIYEAADIPQIVRAHLDAIPPSLFG